MKKSQSLLAAGFILFYLLITPLNAQTPTFDWAIATGGTGAETTNAIAVDDSGNVYATGTFEGIADFDPGAGVYDLTSAGLTDIFIAKYSASGNFMWAKQIGGTSGDVANSIAVDDSGNVFSTGYFGGTIDFDPGAGTVNLTASATDIYISKLDRNGNYVFATDFGSSGNDAGWGITLDASGNVYLTGYFGATVDFDPGPTVNNLVSATIDAFVLKLNNDCDYIWAKATNGNSNDYGWSITVDLNGNVYSSGYYSSTTLDLDPGTSAFTLTNAGGTDTYIWKLDANGDFVWAVQLGSSSSEIVRSLATDNLGDVYSTGNFGGTIDFDPGIDSFKIVPASSSDAFILKLSSSGNFLWAKQFGSTSGEIGKAIVLDGYNNVYTTGNFASTVDFDPGPGSFNLPANGFSDVYMNKLNSNGDFIWAYNIGGTASDNGNAIAIGGLESVYTAGHFNSTCDFNQGAGTYTLTSAGGNDNFIHKMNQCTPPSPPTNVTSTLTLPICYNTGTTLSASGSGTLGWYSAPTGGTYLGGGNTFSTPSLTTATTFYVQDSTCTFSNARTAITVTVNPQMYVTTSGQDTICGGTAVNNAIIGSGGTGPYSYTWNATQNTNLSGESTSLQSSSSISDVIVNSGSSDETINYTFTATDNNGCSITGNTNFIILRAPVDIAVSFTDATCGNNNGTINLGTVTGGTSTHLYSLDNSLFSSTIAYANLAAGTHTITVQASNNCTYSETLSITNLLSPSAVILSPSSTTCGNSNGVVAIGTVTGGTGPFTYSFNNSAFTTTTSYSNLSPGIYPMIVKDANGCELEDTVTVGAIIPPALSITSSDSVSCFGGNNGTATVGVANGTPTYQYSWAPFGGFLPTANGLSAGTYTCTVQDANNCVDTATVVISQPALLVLITSQTNSTCGNSNGIATANVTGGVLPYTYLWSNGDTTASAASLLPGQYSVQVTDANSCAKTATVTITGSSVPTPDICLVTVDSTSTNNIIIWDKTLYPMADTFYVYRDTANNNYALIGIVPFDSLSLFVDTTRTLYTPNGDPNVSSWRYKIALKDSCGNLGAKSAYHQTIFFQNQFNSNFNWTHYQIEGQPTPVPALSNYVFYRDTISNGNWTAGQTLSASSQLYTDLLYSSYPTGSWRVETSWTISCDPTRALINTSRSNIKNNIANPTTGINEYSTSVQLYPNPANDKLIIILGELASSARIDIYNAIGQHCQSQPVQSAGNNTITVSELAAGIYTVVIILPDGKTVSKKLIKN